MRRASRAAEPLAALLLAFALLGAAPRRFAVAFQSPMPGEPLFGEVEVAVVVRPASTRLERVEVYVDGVRAGVITKSPWRLLVDVGDANVAHRLQLVATAAGGAVANAELTSGTIAVSEEINVELHPLFIRVERGGAPVAALRREDFAVYDDGARQQIVTFERGDVPFTAVVLLDASSSMEGGRLTMASDAVLAFARAMQRLDEAKLLLFADRVLVETPFTNAPSFLTLALPDVTAGGGTAVNDALALALGRLEPRRGRKVALLLSDGVDVESVLSMREVLEQARKSGVILYWLRLGDDELGPGYRVHTPWRDVDAHEREQRWLRQAIEESGGRVLTVGRVEGIRAALADVLQELREQYVIGYYPSRLRGSGEWHEVKVEVAGPSARIRTPRGYTEP
ncbi:MAG TPA: VWA domain-containing protein [Thermoanaerobaculia bacterium]|nr:VWA domain-containing protein [Thermoanaerobaculia bacterium]HXT51041.1 VWA domain-containing protein [Thermoanaerobaculia bacterium]